MDINARIRKIIDDREVEDQVFARDIGMSKATLSQRFSNNNWKVDELIVISKKTGYDLKWILTGEGNQDKLPVVNENQSDYGTAIKRIPFYDVEAVGGLNGGDVTAVSHPTSTIDIGDFLRDSEAAIRMAGNSMMPGYPPGCILGLVQKKNKSIIPGEVYVYEDEDGRHCKRLFYKNDDATSDTYVCYSDTTTRFESGPREGKLFYPPYEIKATTIIKLFTVVGVIKRNTNGVIRYKQNEK